VLNKIKQIAKEFIINYYYGNKSIAFVNQEGISEYNFIIGKESSHSDGISAMLRVKNEETKIRACLSSIIGIFDEIIIIDNGSTDSTYAEVERIMNDNKDYNIQLYSYPFALAKIGKDNQATSANSVHSLVYYSNWCISKCKKKWIFKWDGDMILPRSKRNIAIDLADSIRKSAPIFWNVKGQTVYLDGRGMPWAANNEINEEERAFKNNSAFHFKKVGPWERITCPFSMDEMYTKDVVFYELKDSREDEFSHWSSLDDLTPRKKIEVNNYNLIKNTSEPSVNDFTCADPDDMYLVNSP